MKYVLEPDLEANTGNLNSWEMEAGGLQVEGHFGLSHEFEASMCYLKP